MDRFVALLKSRKVWIALATLGVAVAVHFGVEESKAKSIADAVLWVGGMLIGGIAVEDAGLKASGRQPG